ncbi:MAG: hypothetical protein ACO3DQ_00515 [Cephaloticoccus sp.]
MVDVTMTRPVKLTSFPSLLAVGLAATGCNAITAKLEPPPAPAYTNEALDLPGMLDGRIAPQVSVQPSTPTSLAPSPTALSFKPRPARAWPRPDRS